MSVARQTLIPVPVPWEVVASTPLLGLSAAEGQDTVVRFAAHFGLEHDESGGAKTTGFEVVQVVDVDTLDKATSGDRRAPYKVIKNVFVGSPAARFQPAHSGSQVLDEEKYDWGKVSGRARPGEDFEDWSLRRDQAWLRTSICPDPGFYQVDGSLWLAELDVARFGMKHFVIAGPDNYVEVIAEGWSWSVESILDDW